MLAPLTDSTQKITLIQDSGIQFLDFAVKAKSDAERPGKFVRQTANGPLLLLEHEDKTGKYLLRMPTGTPEVVKPEFSFALTQSLTLLENIWLPLPVLRVTAPRNFIGGPENWARMQIIALEKPDVDGNTHRVCIAFDTKAWPEGDEFESLALSESDAKNGVSFALAWHNSELGEFLDLTWVDGWLREAFTLQAAGCESRHAGNLKVALKEFEYQAHYLNVLNLIGSQLELNEIKIHTATLQEPVVNVDLILDVGNSHTCGILVEDHPDESNGLKQTYELQLRRSHPATPRLQRNV